MSSLEENPAVPVNREGSDGSDEKLLHITTLYLPLLLADSTQGVIGPSLAALRVAKPLPIISTVLSRLF